MGTWSISIDRFPLPDWILCSDWKIGLWWARYVIEGEDGTHHFLCGQEEITDGRCEIEHRPPFQHCHFLAHSAQEPQVVVHRHEREGVQRPARVHLLVRGEHFEEVRALTRGDGDARDRARRLGQVDIEEVEERVRRVRVVPAERLQAELPMHEDDCVAGLEEVLRGRRPARPCAVVIDKIAPIGVLGLNTPALKLSRKRTLDERHCELQADRGTA